jgi:maltose-binding protein MalE
MNMTKKLTMIAAIAVLSLSLLAGCAKDTTDTTSAKVPDQGSYSVSGDVSVDEAREATGAEAAKAAGADEINNSKGSN